jgi:hypothetical protein
MANKMKIFLSCLAVYWFMISCSSKNSSEKRNPESYLSFYNKEQKNDSLKIDIEYSRSKDSLAVCVTNVSNKDIIVPSFREANLSYNAGPGFVLFVYEEQDGDYVEMTDGPDYDAFVHLDTIIDRKLLSGEKNCKHVFSPDFFFKFLPEKNYKFVVRYYAENTYEHHNKFVQSNIVTIKW